MLKAIIEGSMLCLTVFRSNVEIVLSSYRRMLMVSKAQVLSPSKPDFNDIMTLQASGVPSSKEKQHFYQILTKEKL